jgi:hypothetical protein
MPDDPQIPRAAIDRNQRPMIGPKALPIRDVPRGCIAESAIRIATAPASRFLPASRKSFDQRQYRFLDDSLAPAQFGNALLAAQAFKHNSEVRGYRAFRPKLNLEGGYKTRKAR